MSEALAVSGDIVVGNSATASGGGHAFAYDLGAASPAMQDLGTLAGPSGTFSEATAVSGDIVVGASDTASGAQHATAWSLPAPTTTVVTSSPNPVTAGQATTLTATVTSPGGTTTPAGSVQFEVGSTLIGIPAPVLGGSATTTETFMTVGTQVVSAVFTPADPTAYNGSAGTVSVIVVPPNSTGITVTTTVAPAGAFTFTAAVNATIVMTVSGGTATGAMIPVTITDTRNTYPGWSVLGQASDFTNPTSNPAGDISGNQLGWAPTSASLADGAMLGPVVAPAAPGLGTVAATLASAQAGTGFGTSALGADLTLAIPPTTPSGAYASVLTLTANPAGS